MVMVIPPGQARIATERRDYGVDVVLYSGATAVATLALDKNSLIRVEGRC